MDEVIKLYKLLNQKKELESQIFNQLTVAFPAETVVTFEHNGYPQTGRVIMVGGHSLSPCVIVENIRTGVRRLLRPESVFPSNWEPKWSDE
jgi:hypothetical protein